MSIPGVEPRSPPLQADSLLSEPSGKPKDTGAGSLSLLLENFPTQESNQDELSGKPKDTGVGSLSLLLENFPT